MGRLSRPTTYNLPTKWSPVNHRLVTGQGMFEEQKTDVLITEQTILTTSVLLPK